VRPRLISRFFPVFACPEGNRLSAKRLPSDSRLKHRRSPTALMVGFLSEIACFRQFLLAPIGMIVGVVAGVRGAPK
jgi:hypothetical protein